MPQVIQLGQKIGLAELETAAGNRTEKENI